ncbi:MAG: sulfite exporter TauE/SafE family protein, partial [Phycisphaerales bacterium]
PILVLLFDMPASIGRNFSFAVQSIGMTSAAIFILSTRKPYAKRVLLWAMAGALVGTPAGAAFVAPHANDLFIKLLFAVIWASFGIMTLVRVREMARYEGITRVSPAFERRLGLFTGLFGGACIASLTGVGIDMLVYTLLVLVLRADLKIAIPTSVMIMAWTSLVGLASNVLLGTVEAEVWYNWLAAAPIVALGAPLGVFVVNRIGRAPTLIFVSFLCLGQFVWTLVNEGVGVWVGALAVGGVLLANLAYHLLYVAGGHLAHKRVEERIL